MAAHWYRGGERSLASPNLKDSWQASRAQKSSYTVRIQSHLVLACLRSLTSEPRITGSFLVSLSLCLSFSVSPSLSHSLPFFYSRPLHSRFPRKRYPHLVVDHYRQTFRAVSAVQMQRNREDGHRRFWTVVLDVSWDFERTLERQLFFIPNVGEFLMRIGWGRKIVPLVRCISPPFYNK